jgi:Phage tail assembly chaperone protein, TAC
MQRPTTGPPPTPSASGREEFAATAKQLSGQTAMLLNWRPDDFWNATPAELAAILSAFSTDADAADGATLTGLMELFPDAPTGGE